MGRTGFPETKVGYIDQDLHLRGKQPYAPVAYADHNTAYAVHDKANPGKVPERLPDLIYAKEEDTKGVQTTNTQSRTRDMEPNDPIQTRLFQGGKKRTKKGKKAKKNKSKKAKNPHHAALQKNTPKNTPKNIKLNNISLMTILFNVFL